MEDVITRYMDDVKTRNYPGPENTIKMPEDELRKFAKDMKWERKLDELGWLPATNFTLGGGAISPNVAMKNATIQGDDLLF